VLSSEGMRGELIYGRTLTRPPSPLLWWVVQTFNDRLI
jgi:hypothetical protein